jgi:hypothetical protein
LFSGAAVVSSRELRPIDLVAAAYHCFRDIFPFNEALSDDALVDGGLGPAVARSAAFRNVRLHDAALCSMTEGRGSFTMEFDQYEVVPPNVASTIIGSRTHDIGVEKRVYL